MLENQNNGLKDAKMCTGNEKLQSLADVINLLQHLISKTIEIQLQVKITV